MDEKVTLGDRIAYEEQMSLALRNKIDGENEKKLKIHREKDFNRKKYKIYRILFTVSTVLLTLMVIVLAPYYVGDKKPALFDSIMVVALTVAVPFMVIAVSFSLLKFIHYRKRRNRNLDTRDYKWRTYSEMYEICEINVITTLEEESRMIANLTLDRQKLNEIMQKDLKIEAENDMGKFISMDEMKALPVAEKEEADDENPLAFSFLAAKTDIEIVTIDPDNESFFYELMQEYLPDTEPEKAAHFCGRYGKAFLIAKFKGENVGICYGWPRAVVDIEDPSFTLQGIAVKEKYQAMGIGRILLTEFEKKVKAYSFGIVGVGSAPGYVEHFYMKNGYVPVCYKYPDSLGDMKVLLISGENDYRNLTRRRGGFVVLEKRI